MQISLSRATEQFLEYCTKELGHSPKTTDNYAREFAKLNRWGGERLVESITIDELNEYFRMEEERGLQVSSVNTARHTIRSFFYYCQYYRHIPLTFDYQMIRRKKDYGKKKIKYASVNDVISVINALDDPQDKLIVATIFDSAVRVSEVVKLRVENVRFKNLEIKGKGGELRDVEISEALTNALEEHIKSNKLVTGPVFRHRVPKGSAPNQGYTVSGLRNRFIRKLKPYGIYPSFHWYRHGKASDLYNNGADLIYIKEFLGHKDVRTTQIYTHISTERKRETYDKHYPKGLNLTQLLDNPA